MKSVLVTTTLLAALSLGTNANATDSYTLMPSHTYPSFEADHWGGLSVWRGKFTKTSGTVMLDREAKTGTLEVIIETASVDVGHPGMNGVLVSSRILDAQQYPRIIYRGTSMRFEGDHPVEVVGELTLNGVTKPLNLRIETFKCMEDHIYKREVCGVNALASFNRADFGVNVNLDLGFKPEIKLAIQAEALKSP